MIYKAIGLMSGSSLDGLDIIFAHLTEQGGKWNYEIKAACCYDYAAEWKAALSNATQLNAKDYLLLDVQYGQLLGEKILQFIEENNLHHQVDLIASHGHTSFHIPEKNMTAQLGNGAAIAATAGLPVITDLRAMDVALRGQGAPIVPMGEKYLFPQYHLLLNIGGIANLSFHDDENYIAFDVCPANRVLNLLANKLNKEYDEDGNLAAGGRVDEKLLQQLNEQEYYARPFPKSLPNEFGTTILFPLIEKFEIAVQDKLRTYTEHIAQQIARAVKSLINIKNEKESLMLASGGGALNIFLIKRLQELLTPLNIKIYIPDTTLVQYKEALIMAFLGVLRWREQNTTLASVTGASRNSIGGALWMGQEY